VEVGFDTVHGYVVEEDLQFGSDFRRNGSHLPRLCLRSDLCAGVSQVHDVLVDTSVDVLFSIITRPARQEFLPLGTGEEIPG
jgi:hypothetical protein